MRIRSSLAIAAVIWVTVSAVAAQEAGSSSNLIGQLQAQYLVTKIPAGGADITEPGSILILQKNNLMGAPRLAASNSYKDGRLKQGILGSLASSLANANGESNKIFQPGEKFYLLKMEAKGDKLNFLVCTAEVYDGARYYASVSFQFAKGSIASVDLAGVKQTVGELFALDQNQETASTQPAASTQPNEAAQPQPEQQGPPQSIEAGQTIDQVVAVMGQPDKVLKVGAKQIYVYKDLKITFIDGKVSDVQ